VAEGVQRLGAAQRDEGAQTDEYHQGEYDQGDLYLRLVRVSAASLPKACLCKAISYCNPQSRFGYSARD
jgi:hypothetical protein